MQTDSRKQPFVEGTLSGLQVLSCVRSAALQVFNRIAAHLLRGQTGLPASLLLSDYRPFT